MRDFLVQGPTSRVVFARGLLTTADGVARAVEAIQALGCRRLVLIGSPRAMAAVGALRARLEATEGGLAVVGVVDDLSGQHVGEGRAQRVAADTERWGADGLVSVSGGTSIAVAKAVAVARGLSVVCVPTTYSGSEATAYYGVREKDGRKAAKRDEAARPRLVLYDPALLASLPRGLAVASVFNALAHAFEVLWLPRAAPQSGWAAREAVRVLLGSLPALQPGSEEAQPEAAAVDELLYGAYLAAYALDAESLGLQHRLAHVLGGAYGLPHAEAHMSILPYVVHFHAEALPTELLDALGTADVAGRVYDVQREVVRCLLCCGVGINFYVNAVASFTRRNQPPLPTTRWQTPQASPAWAFGQRTRWTPSTS